MIGLRILVPEGTSNYIGNPAIRYDTTGYIAVGSSISRSLDRSRFGVASLKIVTNGAAFYEGAYYRISSLSGIQTDLTASVYLRGSGIVRLRLIENGNQWVSPRVFLNDIRWQRVSITGRTLGSNDVRLYVETDSKFQATTIYTDGWMVEPKPYMTTYCDGDQPGCRWNIVSNNSVSSRSGETRFGGRWAELASCDRYEQDLYVTVIGGLGTPPITNNKQSYADSPGSYFQNIKVIDRVFTIAFNTKQSVRKNEKTMRHLHRLRQMLFDIIKPDRTGGNEEFVLEYTDGGEPIYLRARYEAGLEGEWDVRNPWVNSFAIRFLAVSPFFYSDDRQTKQLNFKETATVNYVMGRINERWQELNGGFNTFASAFAIGKRGEIYAVGNFNKANNKATAINPQIFANFVAYWDGQKWVPLGLGANNFITSIAVAPNGDVYVAGLFTSIGGVAANRIARWDGSWHALGTGLDATAYAVQVGPDGKVYAGGAFASAGGNVAHMAAWWDGGTWHPLGNEGGLNGAVMSIAISPDGTNVYFGGEFTDEYGSPGNLVLNRVALYSPDFNQFFAMGLGFDDSVLKVVVAPSGYVYACGNFTESNGDPLLYIAFWNGAAWFGLSIGANNVIRDIFVTALGQVYAVGDFTRIGSADALYIALWNNTTWVNTDVELSGGGKAVIVDAWGNVFVSFNGTVANFAAINEFSILSTAETNPQIYIVGPGTLKWIENQTARKRIYADMPILVNEEIIFDLATGKVSSSVRGDVTYALSAGSDLRSWTLIPGLNRISVLLANDVLAQMQISYEPRHWSSDAVVDAEAL